MRTVQAWASVAANAEPLTMFVNKDVAIAEAAMHALQRYRFTDLQQSELVVRPSVMTHDLAADAPNRCMSRISASRSYDIVGSPSTRCVQGSQSS